VLDILNHSVFLVPVALCWIVAAAITFERVFFLWFRASLNTDVFLKTVQSAVAAGQIDEALRLCLVEPHAPVARVAKAALQYANSDRDELELAVEEATLESVPGLQTRVGYLAMLANVVTLFGLLGTIVGLITSPDRLIQIRRNRLLSLKETRESDYVDGDAVRQEIIAARRLFERMNWPVIDITRRSVEETAAAIINLHARRKEGFPANGD
jgi:hypothetical protein